MINGLKVLNMLEKHISNVWKVDKLSVCMKISTYEAVFCSCNGMHEEKTPKARQDKLALHICECFHVMPAVNFF